MRLPIVAMAILCTTAIHAQDDALAAKMKAILQERIDAEQSVGIVAGVIDNNVVTVVGVGSTAVKNGKPVDGDTIFELGSITKSYTGTLLADMVLKGEVALDQPLSEVIKGKKVPSRGGKFITLKTLANHTSGLPRLPENFAPKDSRNPYADYTKEMMYGFLAGYKLPREPGEKYEYSNYGSGLLGQALAVKAGAPYPDLLRQRFFSPLKMESTYYDLPAEFTNRFSDGHDELLRTAGHWDIPVLGPCGALRSTVNDQLKWLAAGLGHGPAPVIAAIEEAIKHRTTTGAGHIDIALGWHILKTKNGDIYWHNGGTGGFRTWLGYNKQLKRGAVVLSNAAIGVDDIGNHLVDPTLKLAPQKKALQIPIATLEKYVGEFKLAPNFSIVFTRDGSHLSGQATDQPKFAMKAKSPTEFIVSEAEAEVVFTVAADGSVNEMVLKQSGQNIRGTRVGAAGSVPVAPAVEERKALKLDEKTLERYIGVYELDPNFVLTVTRDGARLFVQATGQARFEVFAESETKFFYTITSAELTFGPIQDGKATALTLHQAGQKHTAKRR